MEIFLSSAKRGYGLKELLSSKETDYWNTDDTLPHSIWISFPQLTYLFSIVLNLSYSVDESYTPEKILVCFNGKTHKFLLSQPEGEREFPVDTLVYDIQLIILSNHADGKDSHVRHLKIKTSPTEEIACVCKGIDE